MNKKSVKKRLLCNKHNSSLAFSTFCTKGKEEGGDARARVAAFLFRCAGRGGSLPAPHTETAPPRP